MAHTSADPAAKAAELLGLTSLPATASLPPGVLTATLACPSGELFIADWFRLPEFNALIDDSAYWRFDINTAAGKEGYTRYLLEQHGFLCIACGNSVPSILQNDRGLLFGSVKWDDDTDEKLTPPGYTMAGSVCTDRWSVCVIDRQVMVAALAEKHGKVEAEALVAKWAADASSLNTVTVPPGTYHVYFDTDYYSFDEKFAAPGIDLSGMSESYFLMSPVALDVTHRPAVTSPSLG